MTFSIKAHRTFFIKGKAIPVEIELERLTNTTLAAARQHLDERYPLHKGMQYDYYYYAQDTDGGRWVVTLERRTK